MPEACDCGRVGEHEPTLYDYYGTVFKCEGKKARDA